ncbi:MAG: nuclear transport factor 2 family protein [Chitinophagaceae bacterium]|nr:nuclear transport factor 2 family protein [Chitinophagaceae bacterium]
MNPNEQLIHHFYSCFQNKDFRGMQACYADHAVFSDPVFRNLNAAEVKAMWQMLIERGKDLQLEFKKVKAGEKTGSAEWIAHYTFSVTGNKVTNHIHADFVFEGGKIVKHTDHFSFYKWARQALGTTGLLLGWTPLIQNKVRTGAMKNLAAFIKKNN